MVNILNKFRIPAILCLSLLMLFTANEVKGQVNVSGKVILINEDAKTGKDVEETKPGINVFIFNTKEAANRYINDRKSAKSKSGEQTVLLADAEIVKTAADGTFSTVMIEGGYLLVFPPNLSDSKDYGLEGPVKEGSNYTIKLKSGIVSIGEIVKKGTFKRPPTTTWPTIAFGSKMTFRVDYFFDKNITDKDSRVIIQPYAIHCDSISDSIPLKPVVFEGDTYHSLQDKRKDFDYTHKDPLSPYHDGSVSLTGDTVRVIKTYTFIPAKAKKEDLYYCGGRVVVSDYTHQKYNDCDIVFGTCEQIRPMKFLDFKLKSTEIPLTPEFQDLPRSRFRKIERKLQLRFKVASDVLTEDSINEILLSSFINELKTYANKLTEIRITGTASPEGTLGANQKWANLRARTSMRMVTNEVGYKGNYQENFNPAIVYTWLDVADSLKNRGYEQESNEIRELALEKGEYSSVVSAKARSMSIYETVIVAILENQRVMICTYMYTNDSPLSAEEAVKHWYNNTDYREGAVNKFSNADYYNLLITIKDSLEQRKIVERAYREMIQKSSYHQLHAFSAYIANRKAMYLLADGIINTDILKPFIDTTKTCDRLEYIDADYGDEKWVVNRRQLLANQALMYLKDNELDYSRRLISMLPDTESIKKDIVTYYDLVDYIMNIQNTEYPDTLKVKGEQAVDNIKNSSLINRVVLSSELYLFEGRNPLDVIKVVDSLPVNNSKRWYYKGMLMSSYAGREDEVLADMNVKDDVINIYTAFESGLVADSLTIDNVSQYRDLTPSEDSNLPIEATMGAKGTLFTALRDKFQELMAEIGTEDEALEERKAKNKTPHFLAYFQHCFDLDSTMYKNFVKEGHIGKKIREKYPYKKRDREVYREKFTFIEPEVMKALKNTNKPNVNDSSAVKEVLTEEILTVSTANTPNTTETSVEGE